MAPRMSDAAAPSARLDMVALLMGLAFALMWASAFTSARVIVAHAPPLTALAVRFAMSGAVALVVARLLGESPRLTARQWRLTLVFGVCQNALYLGLNFVAMQTVEASLAAIVASSLPLAVAAVAALRGERLPVLGTLGLLAGFAGVALVMGSRLSAGVDPFGLALCIAGVGALTVATLSATGATSGGNVLTVVGYQMLAAVPALALAALLLDTGGLDPAPRLWVAFVYTVIVPGLLATWVWLLLVRRVGTTRAAVFHFLTPPLGVGIAWALLGERLGPLDLLGVAVVAGGILMVQLSRRR